MYGASEIFREFDLTELYYKMQSNDQHSLNVPYNSIKTSIILFFKHITAYNIYIAREGSNIRFNHIKRRIISNF